MEQAKLALQTAQVEVGKHSQRYMNALLDYNEAAENLRAAQAAYDAALAAQAKRDERQADVQEDAIQFASLPVSAGTDASNASVANAPTVDNAALAQTGDATVGYAASAGIFAAVAAALAAFASRRARRSR